MYEIFKLQKINIYCSISISGSQSPKYINFALSYTVQTLDEKKSKLQKFLGKYRLDVIFTTFLLIFTIGLSGNLVRKMRRMSCFTNWI